MPEHFDHLKAALADRYTLERELGRGGMAVVYEALDVRHDRTVAIKVLRPELAASLGAERFLREIQIAAKLTHPNILPLHDSGEADGTLFYVMPYIEGESLRDLLSREKQLSIDDALQITREVGDALSYAHSLGVVHRDIKPENILFQAGHAVVADFGIARAVSEAGGESLTETGLAVGTPAYMSPEQATATKEIDARTDVYSLGCVLYEMLSGETPYSAPTPMAMMAKKLSEPLPRVSVVREAVPPGVEAALSKSLARTPADRYRTAAEFVAALERPVAPWVPRKRSVRLAIVAALVTVVLVVGGFVVRNLTRPFTVTASNPRQVTFDPRGEDQPAISPDGSEVAYAADGSLYLQSLAGGTPLRIADDAGGPRWSPEGDRIFFGGWTGGATMFALKEVGKLGGPVRILERPNGYTPSLSPDGTRLVYWWGHEGERDSIYVQSVGGGTERGEPIAGVEKGKKHSFSWSPDGQRIAWVHSTWWAEPGSGRGLIANELATSAIWVVHEGEQPVQLTDYDHRNFSPVWLPDNRHLLFVSDRDGPRDIYVVDADAPGEPKRVTTGGEDPGHMSVSADGKRLAYSKLRFRRNIWAVPIPARGEVSISEGRPVTSVSWNQLVMDHDLSPGGDSIVYDFQSDPSGEFHIYKMALEGGTPVQLTAASGGDYGPVWSPDGREIAFVRGDGIGHLWVMDADGGNQRRVADNLGGWGFYDWSSDGLKLIYERGREGLWAVSRDSLRQGFDMPVEFGEPEQWHEDACQLPRRVRNGSGIVCNVFHEQWPGEWFKSLLWLSSDGAAERRFDATSFDEARRVWNAVIRGEPSDQSILWWIRYPRYSPDGSTLYFFGNPGGTVYVMSMPAEGGDPRRVVQFDDRSAIEWAPMNNGGGFAALSVGEEHLYLSVGDFESDIWVMDLDW
jgi:serine/threonine-protein kinase